MFQDSACWLVKERTFKLSLVAVKEKKQNRAMTFLLGKAFPVCSTVSGCKVWDLPHFAQSTLIFCQPDDFWKRFRLSWKDKWKKKILQIIKLWLVIWTSPVNTLLKCIILLSPRKCLNYYEEFLTPLRPLIFVACSISVGKIMKDHGVFTPTCKKTSFLSWILDEKCLSLFSIEHLLQVNLMPR